MITPKLTLCIMACGTLPVCFATQTQSTKSKDKSTMNLQERLRLNDRNDKQGIRFRNIQEKETADMVADIMHSTEKTERITSYTNEYFKKIYENSKKHFTWKKRAFNALALLCLFGFLYVYSYLQDLESRLAHSVSKFKDEIAALQHKIVLCQQKNGKEKLQLSRHYKANMGNYGQKRIIMLAFSIALAVLSMLGMLTFRGRKSKA